MSVSEALSEIVEDVETIPARPKTPRISVAAGEVVFAPVGQ